MHRARKSWFSRQLVNSEDPEPARPVGENGSPDWCLQHLRWYGQRRREQMLWEEVMCNLVRDVQECCFGQGSPQHSYPGTVWHESRSCWLWNEQLLQGCIQAIILWKYGKLGRGNQRACPSCIVRLVRQTYILLLMGNIWIQKTLNSNSSSKALVFRNFNNNKDCYITLNFYWLILSIESLVSNSIVRESFRYQNQDVYNNSRMNFIPAFFFAASWTEQSHFEANQISLRRILDTFFTKLG